MGSFRTRERELRIPRVGTAFDSDDRAVDCKMKQLPWMCLVEPSKGKEAREAMEDERFALGLIIITARRAQQAHRTGEAALHLEAAAFVSMKGKRDLCELHCIIDKVL